MIGRVFYKNHDCNIVDTIHSARVFEGEEVTLFGHLRDYVITKNEVIMESDISELSAIALRFCAYNGEVFSFEKGGKNDFLTQALLQCLSV